MKQTTTGGTMVQIIKSILATILWIVMVFGVGFLMAFVETMFTEHAWYIALLASSTWALVTVYTTASIYKTIKELK